jgi:hypothetical protein
MALNLSKNCTLMDQHSAHNLQQIETIKTSKALTVKALEVIQQL